MMMTFAGNRVERVFQMFTFLFAGCDSSAIVSFVVRKTYLPKVLELACLREGIHVAGGAPKRKWLMLFEY
jgi:hypothetical protein